MRRTRSSLHTRTILEVLGVALAVTVGLGCTQGTAPLREGGVRVLFVGNSLTYVNDLPRTIADLAKSVNAEPLVYRVVAKPNYALEDHYYDGIEKSITGKGWQWIVMQQGPSTQAASATHLALWADVLNDVAVPQGARGAMYSVWPGGRNDAAFDAVRESYRGAAAAIGGMFIPAGEAWREAWKRDATLNFYSGDNFHPSPLGTYVAALVHFEMLYGRPATDLPDVAVVEGRTLNVASTTVVMLQESAHAAVVAWGVR